MWPCCTADTGVFTVQLLSHMKRCLVREWKVGLQPAHSYSNTHCRSFLHNKWLSLIFYIIYYLFFIMWGWVNQALSGGENGGGVQTDNNTLSIFRTYSKRNMVGRSYVKPILFTTLKLKIETRDFVIVSKFSEEYLKPVRDPLKMKNSYRSYSSNLRLISTVILK